MRYGWQKVVYREPIHDFMNFIYSFISFKAFYIDNFLPPVAFKKRLEQKRFSLSPEK